jgi:uncharacterized protein YjdB
VPNSLGLEVMVHEQVNGDKFFQEDQYAGTRDLSLQIEGFQITFNPFINGLGMQYRAWQQGKGYTDWAKAGDYCGTKGFGIRIEGLEIKLTGTLASSYYVEYMAHLQDIGDTIFYKDGVFCGTKDQGRRAEGIQVRVLKKI